MGISSISYRYDGDESQCRRRLAKPPLLSQINEEARSQFLEGILGYSMTLDVEASNDEMKHLLNRTANVFRDSLKTLRGLPSLYSFCKSCFDERLYVARASTFSAP